MCLARLSSHPASDVNGATGAATHLPLRDIGFLATAVTKALVPYPFEITRRGPPMSNFDELRSSFQTVRKKFEEATTLEEKQRLLALSKEIIRAVKSEIEEFRREFSRR